MKWLFRRQEVQGGICEDAVYVVRSVERVKRPCIRKLEFPSLEQHDRYIAAAIPRGSNPRAHPVEVLRVETGQVEFRLSVSGESRTAANPRMRLTILDRAARLIFTPFRDFPAPQSEEIMVVFFQKIQVRVVIKNRRRILVFSLDQPYPIILEIPPSMRARQVNGLPCAVGEISWVRLQHTKRSFGG